MPAQVLALAGRLLYHARLAMITFLCHVCRTRLSVGDELGGQYVRCPSCRSATAAPAAGMPPAPPVSPFLGGGVAGSRRFGFPCPYCSSRLEATTATSGQDGACPTCGSTITIPLMDRSGRLIDPRTREIIKPDPHPVHAYAAAGERAPIIVRDTNGAQHIRCPRCNTLSGVAANTCRSCGVPFTMEGAQGTAIETSRNNLAVASLVLGIISIPAFFFIIPAILALIFGIIAVMQVRQSEGTGGRGLAIGGIVCGSIGLLCGILMIIN